MYRGGEEGGGGRREAPRAYRERIARAHEWDALHMQVASRASLRGPGHRDARGGRRPFRAGRAAPTPILIKRSHKRLTNWPYVRRFIGVPERGR